MIGYQTNKKKLKKKSGSNGSTFSNFPCLEIFKDCLASINRLGISSIHPNHLQSVTAVQSWNRGLIAIDIAMRRCSANHNYSTLVFRDNNKISKWTFGFYFKLGKISFGLCVKSWKIAGIQFGRTWLETRRFRLKWTLIYITVFGWVVGKIAETK